VPIYHRLAPDGHASRRTMADALEELRTLPDFGDTSCAHVRVQPLRLPCGDRVGLTQLEFVGSLPEVVYLVSLPTAARFRGKSQGAAEQCGGDIFALDQAIIDAMGGVTLADGRLLQAVEIIPARLATTPSELEWRIINNLIAVRHAKDRCVPYWRDKVPADIREIIPASLRRIDCQAVSQLEAPPLKVLAAYIADREPTLPVPSLQKLADALGAFGVRTRVPRPRRRQSRNPAVI
jgi:hypothetical protein